MHKNKQVIEKYQECIAHYRAFVDRGGGALWHENFRNSITFGVLRNAQALGDRQALLENN